MPRYVVECYLAQQPSALTEELVRARRVAELGDAVSYVRTTHIPGDETCLHVFEAASSQTLWAAAHGARLEHLRIVEAVETTEPPQHEV
jgi:uncharacterized protein YchJ